MPLTPYYEDGWATIYHADCREIVDALTFDAVVTDPPYGVEASANRPQPGATRWADIVGDGDLAAVEWLFGWLAAERPAAVFGANNWPHLLPHKGRWVCWDKRVSEAADRMLGSAFELAWVNVHTGYDRMIRCQHGGAINANGGARVHPTEKPVAVLRSLVDLVGPGVVLDPFMGSGTTLRAAKDLGRRSIGVEIEERYCEIAAKRLAQEVLDFGGAA